MGLTADDVAGAANEASAGSFATRQLALLDAADELLAQRTLPDVTWAAVQAVLSDREVIELCLLVGHYQGLATTIGGLGIQVERVSSAGRQGG